MSVAVELTAEHIAELRRLMGDGPNVVRFTPDADYEIRGLLSALDELRGYIRIRTPDDPDGWTAQGDLIPGMPYTYTSSGVAVYIDWAKRGEPGVG